MNPSVPSTRTVLERMLANVAEMRRALQEASAAAEPGDADVARALVALDDLEARLRRMLERERS
ncbi:MAG TPA: hypothetical protein VNN19_05340 [bacterium]|nr:hypothetical protein [bacterium]